MPRTDNYAYDAINQPADSFTERHHNLVEHAVACLTFPELPNYRDSYLYLYPDGSVAAFPVGGRPGVVAGHALTILTAIFRTCAELPKPCPCRLVCCPYAHLRCCKCETTADLVLVGDLPLALRRAWCTDCHRLWELKLPDYAQPAAQ